jgi:hypothetical protein
MELRKVCCEDWRWKEQALRLCPMVSCDINGAEPLGSTVREFISSLVKLIKLLLPVRWFVSSAYRIQGPEH